MHVYNVLTVKLIIPQHKVSRYWINDSNCFSCPSQQKVITTVIRQVLREDKANNHKERDVGNG